MEFETVVGLEVHVQLQTRTKLFCGCVNRFNPDEPNVQTCPTCLGLPGTLPVMNRRAYELGVRTALALNCSITGFTKWDRKQYFYPDLPKAYQISQYDLPFSADGYVEFEMPTEDGDSVTHRVGIIRAHLEEDAGKNVHDESGRGGDSRVDLNRTGTPLVEIVTEPDIRSAAEARRFLEELRLLLVYLGVSDCNMQEGSLRCDANVNVKVTTDDGHVVPTPIVEIKNLNSFSNVERAIVYEAERQFDEFRETKRRLGDVPKQTRGWNPNTGVTTLQREKEEAADYRYFPDPDLLPVTITEEAVQTAREALCEFPADKRARFEAAWQLSRYDATVLVDQGPDVADYFETVAQACGDGKLAANWVTQDVLRELNERQIPVGEFPIDADTLGAMLTKIANGDLTTKSGREVFSELLERIATVPGPDDWQPVAEVSGRRPPVQGVATTTVFEPLIPMIDSIIEERGLAVVSDTGALEGVIDTVIAKEANAKAVEAVRGGKDQAAGPLIGQVMQEMKGADAKTVRAMLLERIKAG